MNKERRTNLLAIKSQLNTWITDFTKNLDLDGLRGFAEDLGEHQGDEQDYFDNMPEGLQNGEKGLLSQTAIDAMQEAIDAIEAVAESLEGIEESLNDAADYISAAVE